VTFAAQGVRPNVVSYSTVISSLANARSRRREMERAQEVFAQMVQQGVRPDIKAFGALIHGHATMGDLETVRNPQTTTTTTTTTNNNYYKCGACARVQARRRVEEMRTTFGLSPDVEIHTVHPPI
jgi:pentatricopeptide repeat protein